MSSIVYVTCPDSNLAEKLAELSVKERLAACANIIPRMTSIYEWEGKIQKESEVILILKTQMSRVAGLTELITANHPYDCPCVIALPIEGGNQKFLDWINQQTSN